MNLRTLIPMAIVPILAGMCVACLAGVTSSSREVSPVRKTIEPENLATVQYGAIPLPSSQSTNADAQVEKAFDGSPETKWVSAPGVFPNWIEIRWPQPVSVSKIIVTEDASGRSSEYRIDALVGGKWAQVVPPKANASESGRAIVEEFKPARTTRVRYYMLKTEGDPKTALSVVSDLQVWGTADWLDAVKLMSKPNWRSEWIWYPEGDVSDVTRYFRRHFAIEDIKSVENAFLQIAGDDSYVVYLNGNLIGKGNYETALYDVRKSIRAGDNVLAIQCYQSSIFAGLIAELSLIRPHGEVERVVTDKTWKSYNAPCPNWNAVDLDESEWRFCKEEGMPPHCANHAEQRYIDVSPKEPFRCKVASIEPAVVKPGMSVKLNLEISAEDRRSDDYAFVVSIGERSLDTLGQYGVASKPVLPSMKTSAWEPGHGYPIQVEILLPTWAPHGAMPISVEPVGNGASGCIDGVKDNIVGSMKIHRFAEDPKPWPAVPPKTEVRYIDEQPKLFVNGKMITPFIMTENWAPSYQSFGEHAKTGAHVWRTMCLKWVSAPSDTPEGRANQELYLAKFDQQIGALLRIDPNAYIIICPMVRPTKEWTDTHPDEATLLADGTRLQYSLSSQVWAKQIQGDIGGLVKHLQSGPYAGHVIGVQFEMAEETYYFGLMTNQPGTPREKMIVGDYSPVHLKAFRAWLRDHYTNDVNALRDAWKDPSVTFETAAPDLEVLRREDFMMFRDPAKTRMPMDYWTFHADEMANRAIDLARAIKTASGGKYLCGLWGFYSNGFNAAGTNPGRTHHCGYLSLEKVLDSPHLDYIAPLNAYTFTRWGTPMVPINLAESIRRHKKMLLVEFDVRTFYTPLQFTERTYSRQETLSVIRRDIAASAMRSDAHWWVGFATGTEGRISVPWFGEESVSETLAKGRRIYDAAYRNGGSKSISEVAVFMNNWDVPALDLMYVHKLLASAQYQFGYFETTKLGAPVDYYLVDDIGLPSLDQYKVLVFANAYNLSQTQRDIIKSRFLKAGKTVVWLYAPGFSDERTLSVEHMKDLTGIGIGLDAEMMTTPEVRIEPGHALTAGVLAGLKVYPHQWEHDIEPVRLGPLFYVDDKDAEILGRYAHNSKPAYAAKKMNGGTSVYMAVPYMDASVLRAVCKSAGVHLYTDQDAYLDATHNYLLISATQSGIDRTISLPHRSTVYDVWAHRVLARNADSFRAAIGPLDTGFYFIGSDAEVDGFVKRL